jgi:hypothetical protein
MSTKMLHLLGFGPTTRPRARWTPILVTTVILGAVALLADGFTTILALSDSTHPGAIEANPLIGWALGLGDAPAVLALKLFQVGVLVGLVDYARRRGLPRTALAVAVMAVCFGIFATLVNLFVFFSPADAF